jgi:hypothetical protein
MSNPFQHSKEAGVVYVLLEDYIDNQEDAGSLAIAIVEQLRRSYNFVPKRLRNQPKQTKWKK